MVFFTIYWQSSPGWRSDWRQQSPEWTIQLADHFDFLLEALDSPEYSPERLSMLFSCLRDQLRDHLSNYDPQKFPRRGQISASASAILELLFGSIHGPGIEQHFSCAGCGAVSQTSRHFPYLSLPIFPEDYRRETDPRFVPLETLLTRFIKSLTTCSSLCGICHGPTQVQSLTMINLPWIWFETQCNDNMSPSPTLLIELSGQDLIYELYSTIYLGENHFTTRMRGPSGTWWNHDGMWKFGIPRRDPSVQTATDLLHNGRRYAYLIIYRRSDH